MARTLEMPEVIFDLARLTLPETKVELAVALYAAGRQIEPHFDEEDLQADAETLKALGRL